MVLGKKHKKGYRKKALQNLYTEEGPIYIKDAYKILSTPAFSTWIRLSVASKKDLAGGRQHIANILGYSYTRSNSILLELKRNGFVLPIPNGPWKKTQFIVVRKPLLGSGHGFVRYAI